MKEKKNYVFVKSINCNNNIIYWIIALDESTDVTMHHEGTNTCSGYYEAKNVLGPLDSLQFIKDSIKLYR